MESKMEKMERFIVFKKKISEFYKIFIEKQ